MAQIKGSGNISTREVLVNSFLKLQIKVIGEVNIIQSTVEKVLIETDDNLQSYIWTLNSGRTLYVTQNSKIIMKTPIFTSLKISIYVRQINSLENKIIGNLNSNNQIISALPFELGVSSIGNTNLNIKAPSIKAKFNALGDIQLSGESGETTIQNKMYGNLNCKDLISSSFSIENRSVGNIQFFAKENITIKHRGVGNINYFGTALIRELDIKGVGEVTHKEM